MTSSSCLLSDLNGAADAVLKIEEGDTFPHSLLSPPTKTDIPSTECSTPPDENGANVSDRYLILSYISVIAVSSTINACCSTHYFDQHLHFFRLALLFRRPDDC